MYLNLWKRPSRLVPRERVQWIAHQIVDALQFLKELVDVRCVCSHKNAGNEQLTEDWVEEFNIPPHEQFSERICEQIVNVGVSHIDAQDSRQRIEERLTRTWNSPVPPDKEEVPKIHQLMARLSE